MQARHFGEPWRMEKLPNNLLRLYHHGDSNRPFATHRLMNLQWDSALSYCHSRQRAGLTQDLLALSFPLKPSPVQASATYAGLKWNGMRATHILPELVSMLYPGSVL